MCAGVRAQMGTIMDVFTHAPKRPSLVFLAACNSVRVGECIVSAGVDHVIATSAAVYDDAAREFATTFYRRLVKDHDGVHDAFETTRRALGPRGETFVLLHRNDGCNNNVRTVSFGAARCLSGDGMRCCWLRSSFLRLCTDRTINTSARVCTGKCFFGSPHHPSRAANHAGRSRLRRFSGCPPAIC